jgi:glycosyltransferase involved in cell wall biosynthesis
MKVNNDYIIWIGSVFDDETVLNNIAVSPAANKWQFNFINALNYEGVQVVNIGHCPERVFPYGGLFVNKRKSLSPVGIKLISSSYLNLPIFRIVGLNILILFKLVCFIRNNKKKPVYLISYNTYSYYVIPLLFSKYFRGIKWISIIADPMFDNSDKVNPFNIFADAKIFLSYKLFTLSTSPKKIHIDGGISRINELNKGIFQNGEKQILYTGAIARHTGIELLTKAFALHRSKNTRLIVCGKGNNELFQQAIKGNDKITFLGMIDEQKLASLYSSAYLFINPRLVNEETNNSNFPSKLLEYLSYCKPIISTYTGGIHPDYKEIIDFIYTDNPQELADKIDEIASWDDSQYLKKSDKMKSFVEKNKLWSTVVTKFSDWTKEL